MESQAAVQKRGYKSYMMEKSVRGIVQWKKQDAKGV